MGRLCFFLCVLWHPRMHWLWRTDCTIRHAPPTARLKSSAHTASFKEGRPPPPAPLLQQQQQARQQYGQAGGQQQQQAKPAPAHSAAEAAAPQAGAPMPQLPYANPAAMASYGMNPYAAAGYMYAPYGGYSPYGYPAQVCVHVGGWVGRQGVDVVAYV